ncbi:MAG: hypothetical protein ABUL61_01260 [Oleiharenicola lentus]
MIIMRVRHLLILLACAVFAGCESAPEGVASVPPQVQTVDGSVEKIYLAGQQAFRRLDFTITRSAMGRIEAVSAIHTSETFGNSRQLVAKVAIHEAEPGKSEVELWITEETASQSMGGTRRQPLCENGFFGLYFAMLQQVLQEQATANPVEKN